MKKTVLLVCGLLALHLFAAAQDSVQARIILIGDAG